MSKLPPTLLALSLALALASAPALAQQVSTSHGVRSLPRIEGMKTEAQFRQALYSSEQILDEVMQDVDALERARTAASGDAASLAEAVKRANVDYERAKTAFEAIDKTYRDDLAAFQQRQAAQEADTQRQRAAAAPVEALPSAQRDIKAVYSINEWAAKIAKEGEAIEVERKRLLADHDRVEVERVKLVKQQADAEAKLKASRAGVVGEMGSVGEKRKRTFEALSTTVHHVESVRDQLNRVAKRKEPASPLLDSASAKLRAWEMQAR